MEERQTNNFGFEELIGINHDVSLDMRYIFKILLLITVPAVFSGMNRNLPVEYDQDTVMADTLLTTDFVKNPNGDAYDYIRELAVYIGVDEQDLFSLIYFETGGTMDARIRNPNSSAGGVLQFIDASSRKMLDQKGNPYKSTEDLLNRCPDMACQLAVPGKTTKFGGPAYQYLSRFDIKTKHDLFMAVFYPAAVGKGPNFLLPKEIQNINSGIHTVEEYVRRVDARISALGKF